MKLITIFALFAVWLCLLPNIAVESSDSLAHILAAEGVDHAQAGHRRFEDVRDQERRQGMSVSIGDGTGWPHYTQKEYNRLRKLLHDLEKEGYAKRGLDAAIHDGRITQAQARELRCFIDYENA